MLTNELSLVLSWMQSTERACNGSLRLGIVDHGYLHDTAINTGAVPLEIFLRELFSDMHYERITNSKPDVGNCTFHGAFKDAQVRFTHFVRVGDGCLVSTEWALGGFCDPWYSNAAVIRQSIL